MIGEITISATGRRSENPYMDGSDWSSEKNIVIIKELFETMKKPFKLYLGDKPERYNLDRVYFISGGANGIDQMFFELVDQKIKPWLEGKLGIQVINELALPFIGQEINWKSFEDKQLFHSQLYRADIVTYVDKLHNYKIKGLSEDVRDNRKYFMRDKYMVDRANYLIAGWDNIEKGGTWNTIKYAQGEGCHPMFDGIYFCDLEKINKELGVL